MRMRYVGRKDIVQTVVLDVGPQGVHQTSTILDFTTKNSPTDEALLFVSPFVTLMTPVRPDWAGRFFLSRLHLDVDGETVVNGELVEKFLLAPPCQIALGDQELGEPVVFVGRSEEALLGGCRLHFLPNGTRIVGNLRDIPGGLRDAPGGPNKIRLNSGTILFLYSTRPKQGALFEVGLLDKANQVNPISHEWPHASHVNLAQELESATFRRLLEQQEMEMELRFQQEETKIRLLSEMMGKPKDAAPPKPPPPPKPVAEEQPARPDFEETFARATRHLVAWGIMATVILVAALMVFFGILKFRR